MKAYVRSNGIVLTGKAWEIRYMLKKYRKNYIFVKDWVETQNKGSKNEKQSL